MNKDNIDFKKCTNLGEPLSLILQDNTLGWQYEKSFRDSLDILQIKWGEDLINDEINIIGLSDEFKNLLGINYTIDILKEISNKNLEDHYTKIYISDKKTTKNYQREHDTEPLNEYDIIFNLMDPLKIYNLTPDVDSDIQIEIIETVLSFLGLKYYAKKWLKSTINHTTPLEYRFELLDYYDYFILKYNKIQKLTSWNKDNKFYSYLSFADISNLNPFFIFGSYYLDRIFSRLFLDFLFSGGLHLYGFCQHCNSFFIAKRRGRKKFCSDVCRALNQRK